MSDIIAVYNEGKLVFADPLDDSGDGDASLPNQMYYSQDEVIQLLNDIGHSVSDERKK